MNSKPNAKTWFKRSDIPSDVTIEYVQPSEAMLDLNLKFKEALAEKCDSERLFYKVLQEAGGTIVFQVHNNAFKLVNDGYVAEWQRVQ